MNQDRKTVWEEMQGLRKNKRKTILFILWNFTTRDQASPHRPYEEVKILANDGYRVIVVAGGTNYVTSEILQGEHLWRHDYVENFETIRIWGGWGGNLRSSIHHRHLYLFMFSLLAFIACFSPRIGKVDYVAIQSFPFFFMPLAYIVARMKGCKFIIDDIDLYPETLVTLGFLKNSFLIKSISMILNFVRKRCDQIIVVSETFKQILKRQGISGSRITVITNALHVHRYLMDSRTDEDASMKEWNSDVQHDFVVVYTGTFNRVNRLDVIMKCALILERQGYPIRFEFYGTGDLKEACIEYCQKESMKNCYFMGTIAKKEIIRVLRKADIGVIALQGDDFWKYSMPGKVFDYLGSGIPIVFSGPNSGECSRMIEENKVGICVEAMQPEMIAAAIERLYSDVELRQEMSKNGRTFCKENFTKKKMTCLFLSVFE